MKFTPSVCCQTLRELLPPVFTLTLCYGHFDKLSVLLCSLSLSKGASAQSGNFLWHLLSLHCNAYPLGSMVAQCCPDFPLQKITATDRSVFYYYKVTKKILNMQIFTILSERLNFGALNVNHILFCLLEMLPKLVAEPFRDNCKHILNTYRIDSQTLANLPPF